MKGMFSFSKDINPRMYNWNKIFIGYCDGSSFSGRREQPIKFKSSGKVTNLYFKGHYVMDAVYDMFLNEHGTDMFCLEVDVLFCC